jgi:hypothetical protein
MEVLIHKKFGTTNTNALKNIHDVFEELDVIDRPGKAVVAKMAGTVVIGLTAGTASLSIV